MTAVEMMTKEMEPATASHPVKTVKSIVVATDGSDAAIAAFHAARLIASRENAIVHVVSVLDPLPMMFTASDGMVLLPPDFYQARDDEQRAIVRKQTAPFDTEGTWTTNLCVGRACRIDREFRSRSQGGSHHRRREQARDGRPPVR
jgi:Universal stress protein family.